MEKKPQLAMAMFGKVSPNTPKILDIDIGNILPNPDQPRKTFDEASLRELADSIERHGLLQPVTVKRMEDDQDRYYLVAGERRFRACQLLGRTKIHGIVLTSGNIDELAIIENLQREDLNPMEEAEALAKLMDRYQYTQEVLGKVVGKAQATISNLLNLNKLPARIKDEYAAAEVKISKSVLMEIARHSDPGEQFQLWDSVKSGGVTVRATREAKKDSAPLRNNPTRIGQMISAGKLFAHRLDMLEKDRILLDEAAAQEIALLRERVNQQMPKLYSTPERFGVALAELAGLVASGLQAPGELAGLAGDIVRLRDQLTELAASLEPTEA